MQSNEEIRRTPPIMGSLPQARPQRRRRMPRRLEDYKLRRVKRARHLQVSSPTELDCSKVALEESEPVSRSLTLRCNMIRSEVHEPYRPDRRSDSFDFAGRIFWDGSRGHHGVRSDPSHRIRHPEYRRSPDFDRRRFYDHPIYDHPPPFGERRHGLDVPFDPREMERRESERREMECRETERRRWEERPSQPFPPQFERGRRPFRASFRGRGRPFVPRGRPMTRAHATASMQDIDMEISHVAHDPNPVVTLHRMDSSKV